MVRERGRQARGTPGAHEFRYSDAQRAAIAELCNVSPGWIASLEAASVDSGINSETLFTSPVDGAIRYLEELATRFLQPLRARTKPLSPQAQALHIRKIAATAGDLLALLYDEASIGTPADVLVDYRAQAGGLAEASLLSSLLLVRDVANRRLQEPTRAGEELDHSLRRKTTYVRFRLSANIIHAYEMVCGLPATEWLDPTPDGVKASPAMQFLMTALNPILEAANLDPIKVDTAIDVVSDFNDARKNGLPVWSERFHHRGSGRRRNEV
ncbi:MAG: hypothetical protein KF723_14110 [Rhizobiaceae bacterium]|nr:hypothetical protein [Rhizobiaceae bacterium]